MQTVDITPAHRASLAPLIAFFTVASMGQTPAAAMEAIPDALAVTVWMDAYTPQPWPADINTQQARAGAAIYAKNCADCHGSYSDGDNPSLTRFPNWRGDVGTDRAQIELIPEALITAVSNSPMAAYLDPEIPRDYTAPPLTGIWSSAPYLHNGSIPTLWHLMRPDQRPTQFLTGGHMLDITQVGVALSPPADFEPWAMQTLVDTTAVGLGAQGHEIGFADLSETDKDALLEFLKQL